MTITSLRVKARLVVSKVLFIAVSSGSSSSLGFSDRIFSLTWSMCNCDVATLLGRYLNTSFTVIPVHDQKYHFYISLICVDLKDLNDAAWRYLVKYF